MSPIQAIVVPHDFTSHSEAALDLADGLAKALSADLHLLHVMSPPPYVYAYEFGMSSGDSDLRDGRMPRADAFIRKLECEAARCSTPPHRVHVHAIESTGIAYSIDAESERLGADLIVMGTHGRTGLSHMLLGSIAEKTLRQSPCPVMTVPVSRALQPAIGYREASRHPASGSL